MPLQDGISPVTLLSYFLKRISKLLLISPILRKNNEGAGAVLTINEENHGLYFKGVYILFSILFLLQVALENASLLYKNKVNGLVSSKIYIIQQ